MRVDQCVSAFRAADMPVLVCLRGSCRHVTGRRGVRLVRLATMFGIKNDRASMKVILLYRHIDAETYNKFE